MIASTTFASLVDHTTAGTTSSGIALGSGKLVDLGSGKFASGHTVLEENVEFTVGASWGSVHLV